jgi:hypothetical protein
MTALSNLDIRKYYLMHQLLALKDEYVLEQLESCLDNFLPLQPVAVLLHPAIKPLRKTTSIEILKQEQNYQGFNIVSFLALCEAFRQDDEENDLTTEELLAML